jgi:phosphoglycolate phosphatase
MPKLMDCIEAVAFDLDGTLIDTAPDLGSAANMMLVMLGGQPLPEQQVPKLIGAGIDEFVKRVLRLSGIGPDRYFDAAAAMLFRNLYGQSLFERSRIYPGVVKTLRTLRTGGRSLCCVTNKESKFALALLEFAGLREFFQAVFCADRPEDRKPSPNLLRAACAHAAIEPAKLLCVGDSRADIGAAHAAGCRVVAVDYGYHRDLPLADLRPDAVVSNVEEIFELDASACDDDDTLRAIA